MNGQKIIDCLVFCLLVLIVKCERLLSDNCQLIFVIQVSH